MYRLFFNRQQSKETAKQRIRLDGVPSIKYVTLAYLCLTTLLNSILSIFYQSPLDNIYYESYDSLMEGDYSVLYNLLGSFFSSGVGAFSIFCSIFMTLYCLIVSVGYYYYSMKIARNQPGAGYRDLSYGLEILPKAILLAVLEAVFIFLWSLLFFFPGIWAAYRYRLAFYALLDDPNISVFEALNRSKAMTKGHKWELFVLDISFIGWFILADVLSTIGSELGYLLGSLTGVSVIASILSVLGSFALYLIVGLWLTAYKQITEVYFYDFAKNALLNPNGFNNYGGNGGPGNYGGGPGNYNNHDDWQNQPPYNNNNNGNGYDSHRDPWN